MHTPLTTDRQRYYHLFSLVVEDLPTGLVDALVQSGHKAPASQLLAVRNGRKPHLPWLIEMLEQGLPHFQIPAELRPASLAQARMSLFQE